MSDTSSKTQSMHVSGQYDKPIPEQLRPQVCQEEGPFHEGLRADQ